MNEVILSAPLEYIVLSPEGKRDICNGCGAKGGLPIPDSLLLLDISEACNIHDYRYWAGGTEEDKIFADREFLDNILTIIRQVEFLDALDDIREIEAHAYYLAVKLWGDSSFVFENYKKVNNEKTNNS